MGSSASPDHDVSHQSESKLESVEEKKSRLPLAPKEVVEAPLMASTSTHTHTHSECLSLSPLPRWTYDVFLSFRGEDTRQGFVDHLYAALTRTGIITFKDDRRLERGKEFAPELLKAIEDSRFAVVVISQNYANSSWCLDELVKIVECSSSHQMGQTILPIFYGVDPSDVRKQKGSFAEAFGKHEEDDNSKRKVGNWRSVLTKLGNLSGWTSDNRNETEIIKEIQEMVWQKLSHTLPSISRDLVGMDSHVKKMNALFGEGLDDVRLIGICGMGGKGKTTVARVYHDRVGWQFEGRCFLDVKEVFEKHGPLCLQEQLLSQVLMEQDIKIWDVQRGIFEIKKRLQHKKILVVLDNVDNLKQLEAMAVDLAWFYSGSRIIITSRDRHILKSVGVDRVYEVAGLNDDDALMLFSWKAFKQDQPTKDYVQLSRCVVDYANDLPLALEVLGSFLHGRSVIAWQSAIARLNEIPSKEILDVLQVSYDGLEELEKKIFLDIACFFKEMDKDRVTRILNSCGFFADIGMQVLIDKSLISVSENKIRMHDLLQTMGKEIVRIESPEEPGKRSRLWMKDDIFHVLVENTGGAEIQGIFLELLEVEETKQNVEALTKLTKLRLLKIDNVHLIQGPRYFSSELRFLHWHGYPSKSLPTPFQLDNICELELCHSRIQSLWDGIKILKELRIINLSHSQYLTKTPDFTGLPNLEELVLVGCTRLFEVHPSIGLLKKLIYLNLRDCKSLQSLPSSLTYVKSLKTLDIAGCCKIADVPGNFGKLECLESLDVSGTAIKRPPMSIFLLKNLKELSFRGCKGDPSNWLTRFSSYFGPIPLMPRKSANPMVLVLPSMQGLHSLTKLDLSYCSLVEGALPDDVGYLSSLQSLNLSGNDFISLPRSISELSCLNYLSLDDCKLLQSVTEIPATVYFVTFNGCSSLHEIPDPMVLCNKFASVYHCFGCTTLNEDDGGDIAFTMLRRYLQDQFKPKPCFDIIIPGSKIPKWFSHQSKGSSISLQLPPNFIFGNAESDSQWMGFAVCVAFNATGYLDLSCTLTVDGQHRFSQSYSITLINIEGNISKGAPTPHLWSFCASVYTSPDYLKAWQNSCFNHLELLFEPGYEVTVSKCGVRLVSREDINELNHMSEQLESSITLDASDYDCNEASQGSASVGAVIQQQNPSSDCRAEPNAYDDTSDEEPTAKRDKFW